jgi:hypothetical protein
MKPPRFDQEYWVHWILFLAVVAGVAGILLQIIRYGNVVESGSIGP